MSNWTHINCCVRGEFTEEKLEELFGKPRLDYNSSDQFVYGSKKYKRQEEKIIMSHSQSKLPCGEQPLNYMLRKQPHYHNKKNNFECFGCDEDVLIIWGDLRWFGMSDKEQYKEIEDIVYKILNTFPYNVRQLTLQAYEESTRTTYIWSSVFNSKPTLTIFEETEDYVDEKQLTHQHEDKGE